MEWQPMDTAPDGDYRVEIDIWDGIRRYADCFYENGAWCYSEYEIGHGYVQTIIGTPKFWMYVPKPPTKKEENG